MKNVKNAENAPAPKKNANTTAKLVKVAMLENAKNVPNAKLKKARKDGNIN